jgi:hypothetical protein
MTTIGMLTSREQKDILTGKTPKNYFSLNPVWMFAVAREVSKFGDRLQNGTACLKHCITEARSQLRHTNLGCVPDEDVFYRR